MNPEAVRVRRSGCDDSEPVAHRRMLTGNGGLAGIDGLSVVTGGDYANLVASYVSKRFGARGLKVYREIRVGKSIIGKNRCIDVFCVKGGAIARRSQSSVSI